ncbi:hypothetical protein AcV7_002342 [Taiwanofungus camphoratus]|nr:hypothetical protein AcV7_002342 [Antrodia cinnamomea]
MLHRDFCERNVLEYSDTEARIIDFERACQHECYWKTPIVFYDTEPGNEYMMCKEIMLACQSAEVWKPKLIDYMALMSHIEDAESAETLAKFAPKGTSNDVAVRKAQIAIQDYNAIISRRFATIPDDMRAGKWVV